MKTYAVVLITDKREVDKKYWVKCNNQEEVDIILASFSNSYTEVVYVK